MKKLHTFICALCTLLFIAASQPLPFSYAQGTGSKVWIVQVGAFRSIRSAISVHDKLQQRNLKDTRILMLYDSKGRLWNIVEVGVYADKDTAKIEAAKFKDTTGGSYIIKSMAVNLHSQRLVPSELLATPDAITPPPLPEEFQTKKTPKAAQSTAPAKPLAYTLPEPAPDTTAAIKTVERFSVAPVIEPSPYEKRETKAEPQTPFTADSKQAELIVARTLFRQGEYVYARSMYLNMLDKYGQDEVIWEHFTDTLIESENWAEAEARLAEWRESNPASLGALRQTARFYARLAEETGNYPASYPWFEELLEKTPKETGAMTDYAFALQNGRDWAKALELFSEVQDRDPENSDVAEAMQAILQERSPRLDIDYATQVQAGDTSINTITTAYSQQVSERLRLEALSEYIRLDRRSNSQGTRSIAREIKHQHINSIFDVDERWTLLAGAGFYTGSGEGLSASAGFDRRINRDELISFRGEFNNPWTDTLDATDYEGTYNDYTLSYSKPLNDLWSLNSAIGLRQYSLENISGYSWQDRFEFGLTRRIAAVPDWTVGYAFSRTRQHYRISNPGERPIDLVDKEDLHSVRTDILHRINRKIALRAFGSAGYDIFKNSPIFGTGAGLQIQLGQRVELDFGLDYTSDTGQVGGGEAKTFTTSIKVLF